MLKLLVEVVACGLIVAGFAMWSVPVALIVAGSITVAAVEAKA